MSDSYLKALKANTKLTAKYYNQSLEKKSEQQKFLEKLLKDDGRKFENIADIACGGGTLSHHLHKKFPKAAFTLIDYNKDAVELARQNNPFGNFKFKKDSIYELKTLKNNSFDLVCCWQTLSWLEEPEKALQQLVRITKPGGKIFASSLFNLDKDVDLYTKVFDYSLESGKNGIAFNYNTYSKLSVEKWLKGKVKKMEILPFHPSIDFKCEGRGIGTYTIRTEKGLRLQISAGMLLNWGVLVIEKS